MLVKVCPSEPEPLPVTVKVIDVSVAPGAIETLPDENVDGRLKLPVSPVSESMDNENVEFPQPAVSLFVMLTV